MHIEVGQPAERATGMALRGFALYGLGDSPRAVAAQLQQAATQGAPAAPVHLHRVARRREQLAGGATAPLSVRASAAAIPPAPARPASASRPCATTR